MTARRLLKTTDGRSIVADRLLGSGGQGEVWRAVHEGKDVAVKLYHAHTSTKAQREGIERLVAKGPPAPYFLWPQALVDDPQSGTFGYVMELREPRFFPLEDFLTRRIVPTLRALLHAATQLADGFLRLHSKGLCYRDISFANVFFDPKTGDVRICDNDNVDISGAAPRGVLGTPRFMAPEVVRGEEAPDDNTDRYSLAVLLFFLLFGGHPLDGAREAKIRCLDLPALERLYGKEPLYIWDPEDHSNRPIPGLHDNPIAFETLYPRPVMELFLRSFTEGLHYPSRRVRESEWRKAFARAVDMVWLCQCESENFYDSELAHSVGGQTCWGCRRRLVLPPRIKIDPPPVASEGNYVILLNRETRLFARHVGRTGEDDVAVAAVVPHPTNPQLFGLQNVSPEPWTLTRADGTNVEVQPGRSAPLVNGNRINFGTATGEVRT